MSEMIILWNEVGRNAVWGNEPRWAEFGEDDEHPGGEEDYQTFWDEFELLGTQFLGDPQEDFYQGQTYTIVYKRKSDGALFGFRYWHGGGKHGEAWIEPNGDEFGIGWDDPRGSAYVFLPVREFQITGYETVAPGE